MTRNTEVRDLLDRFFGLCPFCSTRPRVVLFSRDTGGVSFRAGGRLVVLTHDELCPGCVEDLRDKADKHPDLVAEELTLKIDWAAVALALLD